MIWTFLIWLIGCVGIYLGYEYIPAKRGKHNDGCLVAFILLMWSIFMALLAPILIVIQNSLVSGAVIARIIEGDLQMKEFALIFAVVNFISYSLLYLPNLWQWQQNLTSSEVPTKDDLKAQEQAEKIKKFIAAHMDKRFIPVLFLNFALSCFAMTWFMVFDGGTWSYIIQNPSSLLYSLLLATMVFYPFRSLIGFVKRTLQSSANDDFDAITNEINDTVQASDEEE